MRWLPLLLLLAACGPDPQPVEKTYAFVRRTGPRADTLHVPAKADSLRLAVEMRVLSGRAAWTLIDPRGAEVWGGTVGERDTVANRAIAAPLPGDWRLVVTPDSAMGVARIWGAVVR